MKKCLCLLSFVLCLMAEASLIKETVHLSKGWNAIYLESTPIKLLCSEFFAGWPVVSVGCYEDDAYESTAQYRSDGTEINQKPVSYSVWFADEEQNSSLRSLFGGRCYLVYATNVWTSTFLGIPAQPRMTWRKAGTDGEGFMNLAGVSSSNETTAAAYFGSGPFGSKGTIYQIGGLDARTPSFLPLAFGSKSPTLKPGLAYAVTSERADDWPGVIRVGGTGPLGVVDFGTMARRTSFTVANAGSTNKTFSLVCNASADTNEVALALSRLVRENPLDAGRWVAITNAWTLDLKAGESTTVQLALDRADVTDTNKTYGSVITIQDSDSKMRVRVPLTARADTDADRTTGLWTGVVQLTHVSQWTNETPIAAAGVMKATLLVHVDTNGTATLLPQAVVSSETDPATSNAVAHLRLALEAVPTAVRDSARRITGGLVTKPVTGQTTGTTSLAGPRTSQFDWMVEANDRTNPFRHAWHPDHGEGVVVSNSLLFVRNADWKVDDHLKISADYTHALPRLDVGEHSDGLDADSIASGFVVWKMYLGSDRKGPVVVLGRFALQRFVNVNELEK